MGEVAYTLFSFCRRKLRRKVHRHGSFCKKAFQLEHCWELLKESEKWKLIDKESPPKRGALTKIDDDEDDDGQRNKNKPDGNKKAKDKIKKEAEASNLRDKLDHMVKFNELLVIKTLEAKKGVDREEGSREAREMATSKGGDHAQGCH